MGIKGFTLQSNLFKKIVHEMLWSAIPRSLEFEPYTSNLIAKRTGLTVLSGPFQGMKYLRESSASVLAPKLLGIYERELHSVLEEATALPLQRVVDIGAAEGYYCIGLAMRMPHARIVAYETNETAHPLIAKLAALNHVEDRLEIHGTCTIEALNAALSPPVPTLVVCDAEGAESYLLEPLRVPSLAMAHILVELHDVILGGISGIIRQRFEKTHRIELIQAEPRRRNELPFSTFLTRRFPGYVDFAVSDCRPPGMSWFWMRPNSAQE